MDQINLKLFNLLENLDKLPVEKTALYLCCIAAVRPDPINLVFSGWASAAELCAVSCLIYAASSRVQCTVSAALQLSDRAVYSA